MESLNLYIKDGMRIYLYPIVLQDVFSQALFILEFNIHEFLECLFIICINLQFL